jgi:hypothetical protein
MSIKEEGEKSKSLEAEGEDIPQEEEFLIVPVSESYGGKPKIGLYLAILILVALSSFGLGRLAYFETIKEPVRIQTLSPVSFESETIPPSEGLPEVQGVSTSESVVASKNSDKYHYPWCSGAKRIADANKVVYSSPEEARKAGLTPAANCKGLR